MVQVLRKGCRPAQVYICNAVKHVAQSMSGYFQGQLIEAGVIPVRRNPQCLHQSGPGTSCSMLPPILYVLEAMV